MSRELTFHHVEGSGRATKVWCDGEVGPGGACHHYMVTFYGDNEVGPGIYIDFQKGPIKEVGANGVLDDDLLAILIDRQRCFQAGPYACAENAEALQHLEAALECLKQRVRNRIARGVMGTYQK
jgi:hypothetical protein